MKNKCLALLFLTYPGAPKGKASATLEISEIATTDITLSKTWRMKALKSNTRHMKKNEMYSLRAGG